MNEADRITQLVERLRLPDVDGRLLRRALQHPSYVRERGEAGTESNQRLEFLGDAVLDLVLADHLWRTQPRLTEGALTKLKSQLVRSDSLARVGRSLGVGECLLLGHGEDGTGGRTKASLIADCVEAIIAVVYLSGGLDAAREFVLEHFAEAIDSAVARGPADDPKTVLQELLQERTKQAPDYKIVSADGPPHDPSFVAECWFRGTLLGRGNGRTKRDAEKEAAAAALEDPDAMWAAVGDAPDTEPSGKAP
jgi:ribonuclease-3